MEQDAKTEQNDYQQKQPSSKQQTNKMPKPTLLQQFTYDTYQKIGHRQVKIASMPFRELWEYYTGLRRYMPKEIGQIQVVMLEIRYREANHLFHQVEIDQKKDPQPLRKYLKMNILTNMWKNIRHPFSACYHYFYRPNFNQSQNEQERQSLHQKESINQPYKAVSASQPQKQIKN